MRASVARGNPRCASIHAFTISFCRMSAHLMASGNFVVPLSDARRESPSASCLVQLRIIDKKDSATRQKVFPFGKDAGRSALNGAGHSCVCGHTQCDPHRLLWLRCMARIKLYRRYRIHCAQSAVTSRRYHHAGLSRKAVESRARFLRLSF